MQSNKFSVIIPLYNKEKTVRRAIESVLKQVEMPDEIIVVDDASDDSSVEIVNSIETGFPVILLTNKRNSGVSSARNKGVSFSTGDYLLFLDADDYWHPDFLLNIKNTIREIPDLGVVATNYRFKLNNEYVYPVIASNKAESRCVIDDFFKWSVNGKMPITSSSVCIRKIAFDKIKGFDNSLTMGEDQLLWGRLSYGNKMIFINKNLSTYDLAVKGSASAVNSKRLLMPHIAMFESDLRNRITPVHLRWYQKQFIRRGYYYAAVNNLAVGDRRTAFDFMKKVGFGLDRIYFVIIMLLVLPLSLSRSISCWLVKRDSLYSNKN